MSAAQVRALRSLAEPLVTQFDCDLEEVVIRPAGKRRLVRIVVDHDGGLPLDLVASISRAISRALDDASILGESPFVLEVTSPGVDRPLTLPRHWRRAVGRLVLVTPRVGDALEGRLRSADEDAAVLEMADGTANIRYADVLRAVVQVEFSRIEDVELDEDLQDEYPEPGEDDPAEDAPGSDGATSATSATSATAPATPPGSAAGPTDRDEEV
jgi:ribosome maturation factor RimP